MTGKALPSPNILLAYDGSPHARAAVDLLEDLPLSPSSSINLLAVMPTQQISAHEMLQAALEATQTRLQARGLQVTSALKAGNPAATINEYAAELNANLILIGAKGLRATLNIFLGGVAQQVVEYSNCPVLVVRAPYHGLKHVLLVSDGSPHSKRAIEYMGGGFGARPCACPLIPENAEVNVMHVLPPPFPSEMAMRAWAVGPEALYPIPLEPIDRAAIEAEEEKYGQGVLQDALLTLQASGIQANTVMRRGDAATEIIEFARQQQVDLAVCGSRGLSPISSWLLGSVSRKLVHYADCSVLVVK